MLLLAGLIAWLVLENGLVVVDRNSGTMPLFRMSPAPVEMRIGRTELAVPSHYIREIREEGGERVLMLHFLLPDFAAYDMDNRHLFEGRGGRYSPLIRAELRIGGLPYAASRRMEVLYDDLLEPEPDVRVEGGLALYHFTNGTDAPAQQQLFAGRDNKDELALIFCFRDDGIAIAPGCRRSLLLEDGLSLTYFFKRGHLGEWQEIGDALRERIDAMRPPEERP